MKQKKISPVLAFMMIVTSCKMLQKSETKESRSTKSNRRILNETKTY